MVTLHIDEPRMLPLVTASIRADGPLNMVNFESCLRRSRNGEVVIDLRRVTFIDIYALVGLACAAIGPHFWEGRTTILPPPEGSPTATYLSRMNVHEVVGMFGVKCPLREVHHSPADDVLVELHAFNAGDPLTRVEDVLWNNLKDRIPADVFIDLIESLWELGDNTLTHSLIGGGLLAVQVYGLRRSRPHVDLAIGDVGIGITGSLTNSGKYEPEDDLEAIELALQLHVSSVDDDARGVGLTTVAENVRSMKGKMKVRTGRAARTLYPRRTPTQIRTPASLQGTLVGVSIPCR